MNQPMTLARQSKTTICLRRELRGREREIEGAASQQSYVTGKKV